MIDDRGHMRFRELIELADSVYLFPRDDSPGAIQPNIGLIRGQRQTVLIDAGNSPRHARQIMASMAGGGFPPINTVIYTHHHWDHTFGASVYNADHIIAHHANHPQMLAYARQKPLSPLGATYVYFLPAGSPVPELSLREPHLPAPFSAQLLARYAHREVGEEALEVY